MDMTTFHAALKIMGLGMTGIFVFMLLFGIIVYGLRKLFPYKEEPKADETP